MGESWETQGEPTRTRVEHANNVTANDITVSIYFQLLVNLWFSFLLLLNNVAVPQDRDNESVCVCVCPYLGHASGIKAEDPLVAAGIDPCTVPAPLGTHARVQHAVWVVLTMGQLCTQKHLHTDTGEGEQWLLCWCMWLAWLVCVETTIDRRLTING